MANSRNKGSKNERDISKLFEKWTGFEFTRVPSSGGLRWQRKNDTVGDIICSHDRHSRYFTFSIECKFYKDINFEHLILPNKSVDIVNFWNQASEDSSRAKKIPVLFMRYNMMPRDFHFVGLPLDYFQEVIEDQVLVDGFDFPTMVLYNIDGIEDNLVILPSTALFELDYPTLHKLNKKWLKRK